MPKIFDCFTFFNEYEVLELRLKELYDAVDYFVLVEANKTHSGKLKPWNFDAERDRYSKYLDKIIYVQVTDLPDYNKTKRRGLVNWVPENHQRNCIGRGLKGRAERGDIIFISDCDEIWDKNSIEPYLGVDGLVLFKQAKYYFYVNWLQADSPWPGSAMVKYGKFVSPQQVRDARCRARYVVERGGWHYSYQGGASKIHTKVQNIAETCQIVDSFGDEQSIQHKLDNQIDPWGRDYKPIIDMSYSPETINWFIEKYPHFYYSGDDK